MKKVFYSIIVLTLLPFVANCQITINGNQAAITLAQALTGTGVTISNAVLTCNQAGNGLFYVTPPNVSNLGLDSGIVLTSGVAQTTATLSGANILTLPGNNTPANVMNNPGDADLVALGGHPTYDACILDFDFVPLGDTVKFDYIFSSSEYQSFTCTQYGDIFGFFISGPGITGPYSNNSKNIALVPGGNCPVGVNTINSSTANPCGTVTSPCAPPNNALFVNNSGGTTVAYNGFTHVLTAVSQVVPCQTHHLKLAVADASDGTLDTGVWLKAGSFSSNIINVKLKTGLTGLLYPYIVEGCDTGKLTVTRRVISGTVLADTVHFIIAGTAQNNIDYTHLTDTVIFTANANDTIRTLDIFAFQDGLNEGSEFIKLYVLAGCGAGVITDSIIIEIRDSISFSLLNHDTAICLGNSVIINGQVDSGINMLWTPPNGVLNQSQLLTTITPAQFGTQYYSCIGTYKTCSTSPKGFTIITDPVPVIDPMPDIELCEGDQVKINAIVNPPFNYSISWIPSTDLINTSGYSPTFIGTTSQNIDFTVTSPNAGCTATDQFHVQVWPFTAGGIMDDTIACDGQPVPIWVTGGNGQYLWYPSATLSCDNCPTPIATALGTITYYAVLLDPHGCQDTLDVTVTNEPPFTMNLLNNDTTIYLGESVQMIVEGTAPYLFWTPTDYLGFSQSDDPVATPMEDITYTVTGVSLYHGCPKIDSVHIHVILQDVFVPNAFSPNGDGLNDIFRITCRKLITVQEFRIMNRWGNEVFSTNDIQKGWDGKYKGVAQDPGVYYYMMRVAYPNGKTSFLKGDITLMR